MTGPMRAEGGRGEGDLLLAAEGLFAYLDHFARRVIVDALSEATASYWSRRAIAFESARWKPGDFTGRATSADLTARDETLRDIGQACRNRAVVITYGGGW